MSSMVQVMIDEESMGYSSRDSYDSVDSIFLYYWKRGPTKYAIDHWYYDGCVYSLMEHCDWQDDMYYHSRMDCSEHLWDGSL